MSQPHQGERADRPGRFVTGSVMGHVVRMTMTGAFGITFVFVVDAANLIWISWLGDPRLVAAVGFAFAIQFLAVSSGVGLMIASTALISRRIGAGQRAQARRDATSATVIAFVWQSVVAALVIGFRHEILALSGAEGETARLAARYLAMSMPSLTIMAISLVANGALRAQGDGARSMYVTLVSGAVAMVVDPLLIYGLGLGLDGAAMGINLFRIIMVGMALRYAIGTHDLLARPALADVRTTLAPFLTIALPAILTQLATPSGNYLMTTVIARYGDEAVAGWAVVGRLTVVAFGGIFSLAGAIGGIFGQNFGAGQHDRLRTIYRDALVFGLVYTAITWAVLVMVSPAVIAGLHLGETGAQVVRAFAHVGAGGFLFATALFVSNAAFNALGRPLWGTLTTWARDGVFSLPLALWLAAIYGAAGVIYAQAAASALVGVVAAVLGWRFVQGLAAGQLVPEAPLVTRSLANADRVRRR